MREEFIKCLDDCCREKNFNRAQFIRDAVKELLDEMGFHPPPFSWLPPGRIGKGGRPTDYKIAPVNAALNDKPMKDEPSSESGDPSTAERLLMEQAQSAGVDGRDAGASGKGSGAAGQRSGTSPATRRPPQKEGLHHQKKPRG